MYGLTSPKELIARPLLDRQRLGRRNTAAIVQSDIVQSVAAQILQSIDVRCSRCFVNDCISCVFCVSRPVISLTAKQD